MTESSVVSLLDNRRALEEADRDQLVDMYSHYRMMSNEMIKRAVIERNRIDILATEVLGYEVEPFHMSMIRYQLENPVNLILVYRGAGKSTICTVVKTIHLLLKNPNLRILFASKSTTNSKSFLKEVKSHFESNERFTEIFGEYYDPRLVRKWDESEIEVLPRTSGDKEASVTCVGVDGTIVSKHYDVIISDDLVDEENARTRHMRDKTRIWYYKTLDPCLEPPDPKVPHRGEHHHLGTRYHYDDLWGHLLTKELKSKTLIIPALDENGNSPWPEKHPPSWFEEKKQKAGVIIFNSQFQLNTEAMKGEVFDYDDCQFVEDDQIPKSLKIYMGIDLSVSERDKRDNAQFAIVVIGKDVIDNVYILDCYLDHISFPSQIKKATKFYEKYDPIRAAVEANAYQKAFYQQIKSLDKDYRFVPIHTDKDKMTRALKLTPVFEAKRVFFRRNMESLIDQFVLFPGYPYKDGIDAFDMAHRVSKFRKRRKRRADEPGVL